MKLSHYIATILLLAGSASADDIVIFLQTKNYKTFIASEQVDPPKALAPVNKTSSRKEYQVINMQTNEKITVQFYGAGTAASPKEFYAWGPFPAFGDASLGSAYYVLPQKGGTSLWCGGFDEAMIIPGSLGTTMWRGVGTPLKLSATRTIASVPRTMELSGLEAGEDADYDFEMDTYQQPFGFYTDVITGSIALQEPLTKNASLGITGEVRLNGEAEGEVLIPGTLDYGVELVRRLLKAQKYVEWQPEI